MVCQPGKSKRHPHHEAQVTNRTFLPRKSERECGFPVRSGRVKFGARDDVRFCRWSERRPKYHAGIAGSRATGWSTRWAKAVKLNHSLPKTFRKNSDMRFFGK